MDDCTIIIDITAGKLESATNWPEAKPFSTQESRHRPRLFMRKLSYAGAHCSSVSDRDCQALGVSHWVKETDIALHCLAAQLDGIRRKV